MNSMFLLIVFILSLKSNNYTDSLFAKIGKSITTSENGQDECGLNDIPQYKTIIRRNNCFSGVYPNITYISPNLFIKSSLTEPQSRVSFGREVVWAEAPWAVHLRMPFLIGSRLCSGTLITMEWVLTAAHCFENLTGLHGADRFTISAGDPYMNKPQQRMQLFRIGHPKYNHQDNTTKPYDIGLIKVDQPFGRQTHHDQQFEINPVCLPEKKTELNRQIENATLFGFGIGRFVNMDDPGYPWHTYRPHLERADITLIDHYDFKPSYDNVGCKEVPGLLCAKIWKEEPRFCRGDSGAGLLQKDDERNAYVVIGVASSYYPGADFGCINISAAPYWNFFVSVPQHIDWIHETIKNN